MIEGTTWKSRRRAPRRRSVDVRGFFCRALPLAVLANLDTFMAVPGVVTFTVRGKGSWTVRFGDADRPIEPTIADDADLFVTFVPSAFADFVGGRLDPADALARGSVRTRGDRRLLGRLAQVLDVSPKNAVAARMAAL